MSRARPTNPPAACAPYGSSPYYEYPYLPSLAPGIAFTTIFLLVALTQAFYMFKFRAWWMFFLVAGASLEVLGWVGRVASHYCPYSDTVNTLQITTLIMGPAWTQAGVYCAMWVMIQIIGSWVSPISPTVYLWVCVIVDTICLSLQAIGGGIAGSAASNYESPQTGTTIMVVGQYYRTTGLWYCFLLLSLLRLLAWSTTDVEQQACPSLRKWYCILNDYDESARIYRSVELIQGWTGYLISRERFLIGLDAVPMVLAMSVLAILSPGPLLVRQRRQQLREKRETVDLGLSSDGEDQNGTVEPDKPFAHSDVSTKEGGHADSSQ